HEAILQLTSKPGVGTTFKIFFPVLQPSDYAKTPLISTVRPEDASGTILFVEDEDLLRIMGKELLEAHGFSAMTASNGSEAIEIYRERSSEIDVILMDLVMPVMGGIETYHELRKISPTLPVIICSGYGVESVEHVIKNDPHAGFVHKPYKPDELRDVLMRMMKEEGSKEEL
ncbi:MAG: response regulator, partial [Deltaproteobacteria bacterium]